MKASFLKVKSFTHASLPTLEANVNAFLAGLAGEEVVRRTHWGAKDGGDFWAVIEYVP